MFFQIITIIQAKNKETQNVKEKHENNLVPTSMKQTS